MAYLDLDGLTAYDGLIKTEIGGKIDVGGRAGGIPFGTVDSTSTSTKFTATVDGITALTDGVCVMLKNGVVTSASGFTLNVNSLGALPVYSNMAAATRDTTIFNIAYTMLFVYDSTRVSGGCWVCYRGYDGNTNYFDRHVFGNIQPTTGAASGRYSIGCIATDGKFYGFAQTQSTDTTKTLNTGMEFDGTSLYYQLTTTYAASKSIAKNALYSRYPSVDIRYSCNQGAWMTAQRPVYLILHRATSGYFTIGTTVFTQTLPTSADGLYYVYVGFAYSTANFNFDPRSTIMYHDGERICYLGDSSYTLPAATTSTLGGVTIGNGLSVTDNGQLSVTDYYDIVTQTNFKNVLDDTVRFTAVAADATSAAIIGNAFGGTPELMMPNDFVNAYHIFLSISNRRYLAWMNGARMELAPLNAEVDTQTQAVTLYARGRSSMAHGVVGVDESWTITALPTDVDGVSY